MLQTVEAAKTNQRNTERVTGCGHWQDLRRENTEMWRGQKTVTVLAWRTRKMACYEQEKGVWE